MKRAVFLFALAGLFTLSIARPPVDGAVADGAHDIAVTSVETFGPAAVNISDSNGRYMWVIGRVENHSDHAEMVNISLTIPEPVPEGCARETKLILPGQPTQYLQPGAARDMYWRVRYECHSPATFSVVRQTVTVAATHCDPTTSYPGPTTSPTPAGPCPKNSQPAGTEADVSNNVMTAEAGILVR